MQLGYTTMNTPADIRPGELGRILEESGYTSLWIGEHPHIPVRRTTPYPAGGELPELYKLIMDPFISLTAAASATSELRVGTGVILPLEHDIFVLAKAVSTIDRITEGRFDFGVGVGWNVEELGNVRPDIDWKFRYRAVAESIGALRSLWTNNESEFHGQFFDFDPVWCNPGPVQTPHPPIVCGMSGKMGTRHAVEWADQWMPVDIGLGDVPKKVSKFREAAQAAGRSDMPIVMATWGDPTLDTLRQYRDIGVDRVVLGTAREGWDDPSTAREFIDRYALHVDALA